MANYNIKTDLLKIAGAFMTNLKGKTATKHCLIIPVDEAGLYVGEKGVYLNMIAIEMREARFGDTHCIKQSLDKAVYEKLTDEQRNAIPILGGMHALETQNRAMVANDTMTTDFFENGDEDMPF